MTTLTSKQRAFLKGLAHHQKPPFQVGKNGLTQSLIDAIAAYLKAKELLKLKLLEIPEGESVESIGAKLATSLKAIVVGTIGKNIILFKRNPQHLVIEFPKK